MFCHNCGAAWPDGTKFCGKCGTNLASPEPQQSLDEDATVAVHRAPVYENHTVRDSAPVPPAPEPTPEPAPVQPEIYQQQYYQQQYYQPPKNPGRLIKPLSVAIVITMLISLALVTFSGWTMLNTNVVDMDVVVSILDTFGMVDLEEEMDTLDDTCDDLKKELRQNSDQMASSDRRDLKDLIEHLEDIQEDNSIMKLLKFVKYLANEAERVEEDEIVAGYAETKHISINTESLKNVAQLETVLYIVLVALYFLPALFALLGGLLKNSGLTITALILTLMVQVLFSTSGLIFPSLLVYALQAVLCIALKKTRQKAFA